MCVGSNDAVENQPTAIIGHLDPRFVVSGHWEDFLHARGAPIAPIPFLDVSLAIERAEAALSTPPDAPMYLDGVQLAGRHVLAYPGSRMVIPPPP